MPLVDEVGSDMVTVGLPDGRTVSIPASTAAQLNLQPLNVPVTPEPSPAPLNIGGAPGGVAPGSESVVGNALGIPPPSPVASALSTIATPSVDTNQPPDAISGPTGPQGPVVTTPPPPPKSPFAPVTNVQLTKEGVAGATNQQMEAALAAGDAAQQKAKADALAQSAFKVAYGQQAQELQDLADAEQKRSDARQAALDAKNAAALKIGTDIANAKIDRTEDHPALGWIGVLLAAIGQGMVHNYNAPNPAIEAIDKGIQQKVAAQVQALDQKKVLLGLTEKQAEQLRAQFPDDLARSKMLLSAAYDKQAVMIKQVAAESSSATIQAGAADIAAQWQQKAADIRSAATRDQLNQDTLKADREQKDLENRRSVGASYFATTTSAKTAANALAWDKEKFGLEADKFILGLRAKGDEEAAKQAEKRREENVKLGVIDPIRKVPLLNKAGVAMMGQAAQYDKQADAILAGVNKQTTKLGVGTEATPQAQADAQARAQLFRDKAAALRGKATLENQALYRTPEVANKLGSTIAAAQNLTNLNTEINDLYDSAKGGKSILGTTGTQMAIKAKYTQVMMEIKDTWHLGVMSKIDLGQIKEGIGDDPTNWNASMIANFIDDRMGKDPEGFKSQMGTIAEDARKKTLLDFKNHVNYDGDASQLFTIEKRVEPNAIDEAAARVKAATTQSEEVARHQPGFIERNMPATTGALQKVLMPGRETNAQSLARAEGGGDFNVSGLDHQSQSDVEEMVRIATGGGPHAQQARDQLVGLAADPKLTFPIGSVLRDASPKLYRQVLSSLPDSDEGKQLLLSVDRRNTNAPTLGAASEQGYVLNELNSKAGKVVIGQAPLPDLANRYINTGDQRALAELTRRAANNPSLQGPLQEVIQKRNERESMLKQGR